MTAYDIHPATSKRRFRLAELECCSKSSLCQQNRLRTLLQVHLRQLERDRRETVARISHDQRQFQQRYAPKLDRQPSVQKVQPAGTSCSPVEESVADHHHRQSSNCECSCCRYGLWTGRNRPATPAAQFSREVTVCPVVEARASRVSDRVITMRYSDKDSTKRFNNAAIRRSKTSF